MARLQLTAYRDYVVVGKAVGFPHLRTIKKRTNAKCPTVPPWISFARFSCHLYLFVVQVSDFKYAGLPMPFNFVAYSRMMLISAFHSRYCCFRQLFKHFMHRLWLQSALRSPVSYSLNTAVMRRSHRCHLAAIRCSQTSATILSSRHPSAALMHVKTCFLDRCVLLTGTQGWPRCCSSVSTIGAVPFGRGLVLGDPIDEYALRCASKRTLSHSMEDF